MLGLLICFLGFHRRRRIGISSLTRVRFICDRCFNVWTVEVV